MSRPPDPDADPLDAALSAWTPPRGLDGPSAGEVWRRIAVSESGSRPAWATMFELLGRPAWAVVFVVACILGGVLFAELQLGRQQRRQNEQLARSYLQLIDPLLQGDTRENAS